MTLKMKITLILLTTVILACTEEIPDSFSNTDPVIPAIETVPKDHNIIIRDINPTEPQSIGSIPDMETYMLPTISIQTPTFIPLPTDTQVLGVTSKSTVAPEKVAQTIPTEAPIPTISPTIVIIPTIQPSPVPTRVATTFVSQVTANQDNLVLSDLNLTRTPIGVPKSSDILTFSIKNNNSSTVAAGVSIYKRLGNQNLIVPNHEYSHLLILDAEETRLVTIYEYYPAGESYLQDNSLFVETYMVSNFGLFGAFTNCDEIKPLFNSVDSTGPTCLD